MANIVQDLRSALRSLIAQPGLSLLALISLAGGLGGGTAMIGLLDRALLRTLPVARPEELVIPRWSSGTEFPAESVSGDVSFDEGGRASSTSFSVSAFRRFREEENGLGDLVAFSSIERLNLAWGDQATIGSGHGVSGGFFRLFQVRAALGPGVCRTSAGRRRGPDRAPSQ